MSEVVTRILRAAGDVGRPTLNVVVLAQDPRDGEAVTTKLTAFGCRCVLAPDEASAVALLQSKSDFNALVVDGERGQEELEALSEQINSGRPDASGIAIIQLFERARKNLKTANATSNILIQRTTLQELPEVLDGVNSALALATGEIQRQVEIIARAVVKLGQRLNSISGSDGHAVPIAQLPRELDGSAAQTVDNNEAIVELRNLIQARRLRDRYFHEARFGEPAWDILLDLALAWFENKSVSASSVCIASGVPMSTAMRWIHEMVEAKLIERWIDPRDGRRNLVQLAPATRTAMLQYIAALKQTANQAQMPEK